MAGDNAKQVADWNGSVGERWAADQERTDRFTRPYGDAAIAAANVLPGEAILMSAAAVATHLWQSPPSSALEGRFSASTCRRRCWRSPESGQQVSKM